MPAFFIVIGSNGSINRKFVNDVRAQEKGILLLNWKKLQIGINYLKITLILHEGRFLLILYFKLVLKSSNTFSRNDKTITKSFFWAIDETSFSVSHLLRKVLIQLSVIFMGNAFFFKISFTWNTSEWTLEKSEASEIIKWKSNQLYIVWK